MYKYTPKEGYVRTVVGDRDEYLPSAYGRRASFIKQHFTDVPQNEFMNLYTVLIRQYPTVIFYSKKKVQTVPVAGLKFPATLFDVEEVEEEA